MKKKTALLASSILSLTLGAGMIFPVYAETEDVTLWKIPVDFSVELEENNLFVKGLLESETESLERAQTDQETIETLLNSSENREFLMFPAEFTADNASYIVIGNVVDGFTNNSSRLINLDAAGTAFVYEFLQSFFTEEEEPVYTTKELGTERYIIVSCVDPEDDNWRHRYYYTIWEGDLVEVVLSYDETESDTAISWAEEFLAGWQETEIDAEE